jgi:hypothetical protein
VGPLDIGDKSSLDVARYICYALCGDLNSPCIWGLQKNMRQTDFNLYDACMYIWNYHNNGPESQEYYYLTPNIERRIFIEIDNDNSCFRKLHRAGWSYAVSGLCNIHAPFFLRDSVMFIDTYVDRTFHWGCDTLAKNDIIPYRRPWMGFIHHTFDETHSEYNCVNLLNNKIFLKSLSQCKGLIVLTEYLKRQLQEALGTIHRNIDVHVLYHPTELVEEMKMFSLEKYKLNKEKKLVQIGAWLRNPYSIYELENIPLNKVILRGREMDNYFPPSDYINKIRSIFTNEEITIDGIQESKMCRSSKNKFAQSLCDKLEKNNNSVRIIEHLDNEEYDKLLSENIVFLNLVDCSACNTVIECIVRNTPIIVNRLPALEEVLGEDYPGFYDNHFEIKGLLQMYNITKIYTYLQGLDKERYSLDTFMENFQNILENKEVDYSDIISKKKKHGLIRRMRRRCILY